MRELLGGITLLSIGGASIFGFIKLPHDNHEWYLAILVIIICFCALFGLTLVIASFSPGECGPYGE